MKKKKHLVPRGERRQAARRALDHRREERDPRLHPVKPRHRDCRAGAERDGGCHGDRHACVPAGAGRGGGGGEGCEGCGGGERGVQGEGAAGNRREFRCADKGFMVYGLWFMV